jgi:four helix bundle protein
MGNRLEDLEIYNLSQIFGEQIWELVIKWDYLAKDTIDKQLVRSADSIAANISEGFGDFTTRKTKTSAISVVGLSWKPKHGYRRLKAEN